MQYRLELLLEQMLHTNLYDLKGVQSSLALALHGAVHVNKKTGKEAFFMHGEADADKLTHYLVNKIESLLPVGSELEGNKNTRYHITHLDG